MKAETDICCTSGNAVKVVESLESDTIIFLPDEYLAKNVAAALPLEIICDMMGIPPEDYARVFKWTNTILGAGDPEFTSSYEDLMGQSLEMFMYAQALGEDRKANPRDDITGVMMAAETKLFISSTFFPNSEGFIAALKTIEILERDTEPLKAIVPPFDRLSYSEAVQILDRDLGKAALQALELDRGRCRQEALKYTWQAASRQFIDNLVPVVHHARLS